MNSQLLKLVEKYQKTKSNLDFLLAEQYSLLLHDEFREEFIEEMPDFYINYEKIMILSDSIFKNGLTFDLKGSEIKILKNEKEILTKKLFSVDDIWSFLEDKDYSDDHKRLGQLFLSNTESVVLANLAMHSIDLNKI